MNIAQAFFRSARPLLCLLVLGSAGAAAAQQWLVTPEEMMAAGTTAAMPQPRSLAHPDAPIIELIAPDLRAKVPSPTRIQLRFRASDPATVRPETFKVRYGAFGLDITGRLTGLAKVTSAGIDVGEARLPKGSHRLDIEVRDTAERVGRRTLEFQVE